MTVLTTYADLADVLADLGSLVRSARRMRRQSLRQAATEAGVSAATLSRIENHNECTAATAVQVLRWLDARPER